MAHDVFISYSVKDKATADAACATLEAKGIRCWIAPRDVLAGTEYGDALVNAIGECRAMVLIFSAHANASPHIRREVERAVSKCKIILPFRIEEVVPSGAMDFFLGNTHWLDALTDPLEKHLNHLAESVCLLLARVGRPAEIPRPANTVQPPAGSDGVLAVAPVIERRLTIGEIRRLEGHTAHLKDVAFSPDGRLALSGSHDPTVLLWNLDTGEELRSFAMRGSEVVTVAFSPDGRRALSVGQDKTVRIWEVDTGKEVRRFVADTMAAFSTVGLTFGVAFSPDRRSMLFGGPDNMLRLCDVESGREIRRFVCDTPNQVWRVAFSSDGLDALSSDSQTLRLWDVQSGQEIRSLKQHNCDNFFVAFSPEGRRALSADSRNKQIRLWDLESGREIHCFESATNWITCLAISPDCKRALSGGSDCIVRLLDLERGREIFCFNGHRGSSISTVAFSPDGRFALSGGADNSVRFWGLPV